MNFALPAILLFLIVLPGFMFRSRLKLVEQTTLDYSPFGRVVAGGVLWAITLHIVWLVLAYALGWTLRLDALIGLLSSSPQLQALAVTVVVRSGLPAALYFLSLYAFALIVPPVVRWAITHWRLDRAAFPFAFLFRFSEAPWYYILTGADFDEQPNLAFVGAVVDIAGEAYLYVGILRSFFFDVDGQLDRLVLESAARRPMSRDKTSDDTLVAERSQRFYDVEGTYFVLRYAEIVTLNVKFLRLEPIEEGTMQDETVPSADQRARAVR